MIKLYGSGQTRWVKTYWLLRELDIPFEPVLVNLQQGEHRSPEHLARNPFGRVPVMEDGAVRLFESLAICSYLVDAYSNKGLAPKPGTRERAIVEQWISFAVTEIEQPLWRIAKNRFLYPEASRLPADIALASEDFLQAPALIGVKPAFAPMMVDFPQHDGPNTLRNSPRPTRRSKLSSARIRLLPSPK